MSIMIYTLPSCVQCDMTKKYLSRNIIEYSTIDLSSDPDATLYVQSLGYTQAPVVVVGEDHWSGFRVDKLDGLVEK